MTVTNTHPASIKRQLRMLVWMEAVNLALVLAILLRVMECL